MHFVSDKKAGAGRLPGRLRVEKRGIFKVNAVLHWHFLCAAAWNAFEEVQRKKLDVNLLAKRWTDLRGMEADGCGSVRVFFQESKAVFYIVFGYAGINHCVLLKCVLIFIFKQAVL